VLNQAVRRNLDRFPPDFLFKLTPEEFRHLKLQAMGGCEGKESLKSQFVISKGRGGRRKLPYAFTEHGAIMAANVLNGPRAVQMSVFVVRAFVRMRVALTDTRELARKLERLEKDLKKRLDLHEVAIVDILRKIMDVIDPPSLPEPSREKIGFRVKESRGVYRVRRKKSSMVKADIQPIQGAGRRTGHSPGRSS
jgi:hypothetical protein